MATKNICGKCQKNIKGKHFLRCSVCKKPYDLVCTGMEKLFYIMEKDRRETWTCQNCKRKKMSFGKTSTPTPKSKATTVTNQGTTIKVKDTKQESIQINANSQNDLDLDNITTRRGPGNVQTQNSSDSYSHGDVSFGKRRKYQLSVARQ